MCSFNELQEVLRGTENATNIEIAIEKIVGEINGLNQMLLFDQSYHLVNFENDVYQRLKGISVKDRNKLINRLLRVYFLER